MGQQIADLLNCLDNREIIWRKMEHERQGDIPAARMYAREIRRRIRLSMIEAERTGPQLEVIDGGAA